MASIDSSATPSVYSQTVQPRQSRQRSCRQTRWLGLTVAAVRDGGEDDLQGTVAFEARFRGGVLRETSLFQRRDGSPTGDWLYIRALELDD